MQEPSEQVLRIIRHDGTTLSVATKHIEDVFPIAEVEVVLAVDEHVVLDFLRHEVVGSLQHREKTDPA